jgi:hypothetical protein
MVEWSAPQWMTAGPSSHFPFWAVCSLSGSQPEIWPVSWNPPVHRIACRLFVVPLNPTFRRSSQAEGERAPGSSGPVHSGQYGPRDRGPGLCTGPGLPRRRRARTPVSCHPPVPPCQCTPAPAAPTRRASGPGWPGPLTRSQRGPRGAPRDRHTHSVTTVTTAGLPAIVSLAMSAKWKLRASVSFTDKVFAAAAQSCCSTCTRRASVWRG